MEYVQMTLTDWMEVKHRLKMELQGVKQSFVRIGFVLRKIDDQKLYEQDGYKSVAEFAKAEYGLEASTVSRFMSINREYSIDGYSEHLREEYLDMSRSQLEEMLKLPDSDRVMIQPEAARDDIRELKKFNKAEPVAGVTENIMQMIEGFYKKNPEVLNELFSEPPTGEGGLKRAIEIVNPSGNRSYRDVLYFMMMYENKIVIKKFGTTPEEMTWERFLEITYAIFADSANGPKTWEKHFGIEAELATINEVVAEAKPVAVQEEKPVEKGPEKEIARAQKSEKNQGFAGNLEEEKELPKERAEEQIPGQMEVADYPEMMPESPMGRAIESITRETYEVAANAESEEVLKNEAKSSEKGQEELPKTMLDTAKEVAELEKIAIAENDAIRRKFMAFSRGRMPVAELELVREHAEKTLKAIDEIISLKKGL